MSLKARLKGQQGCDLFWSTATKEARGPAGEFTIRRLTRAPLGDFVGIKPLKQHQTAESRSEKRYGEDLLAAQSQGERSRAQEDKGERQLSPDKKATLL